MHLSSWIHVLTEGVYTISSRASIQCWTSALNPVTAGICAYVAVYLQKESTLSPVELALLDLRSRPRSCWDMRLSNCILCRFLPARIRNASSSLIVLTFSENSSKLLSDTVFPIFFDILDVCYMKKALYKYFNNLIRIRLRAMTGTRCNYLQSSQSSHAVSRKRRDEWNEITQTNFSTSSAYLCNCSSSSTCSVYVSNSILRPHLECKWVIACYTCISPT